MLTCTHRTRGVQKRMDTGTHEHGLTSTQTVSIRGDRHAFCSAPARARSELSISVPMFLPRAISIPLLTLPQIPRDPQFCPLSGTSPGFRGRAGGWSCGGGSGGYCEQTRGAGLRRVGMGSGSVGSCRSQALESPSLSWSAAVLRPWVICHQGCYSRAPAQLRGSCSGSAAALSSAPPSCGRAAPSA